MKEVKLFLRRDSAAGAQGASAIMYVNRIDEKPATRTVSERPSRLRPELITTHAVDPIGPEAVLDLTRENAERERDDVSPREKKSAQSKKTDLDIQA